MHFPVSDHEKEVSQEVREGREVVSGSFSRICRISGVIAIPCKSKSREVAKVGCINSVVQYGRCVLFKMINMELGYLYFHSLVAQIQQYQLLCQN